MKKSTLTFVAFLFITNLLLAHNGDPKTPAKATPEVLNESGVSLKDIFLSDYEGHVLFIDFQAVKGNVINLNLLQGNTIVMNEDVHDLPPNTIYELDIEKLQAGSYRVELRTAQGIYIQKDLVVN